LTRGVVPKLLLAAVVVVLAVVVATGTEAGRTMRLGLGLGGPGGHELRLTVPEAVGVIKGARVVEAGRTVGYVTDTAITSDGRARLTLKVKDSVWPLPTDTKATLRMSGTIKYTDRFVDLTRGRAARTFRDGGMVPANQVISPVEFDTIFNTFDAATRRGLKQTLTLTGQAVDQASAPLHRALRSAPPALSVLDAIVRDAASDRRALSTLVRSSSNVVTSVARANPDLRALITGTADTMTAVASESNALKSTLAQTPGTFVAARRTLSRADNTLGHLAGLTDQLSPGVVELRRITAPLTRTLRRVSSVTPDAVATLSTVRRAAPSLNALLREGSSDLMPRVETIARELKPMLSCVRPWTPEIAATFGKWAGFFALGDDRGTVLHGALAPTPMPNETPLTSDQLHTILPTFGMDFPAVPGSDLNQPWYQPQCNVSADSTNLAKDPEARAFDPLSKSLIMPPPGARKRK
jgi:ABC-type transporter Mla subunit MlaD